MPVYDYECKKCGPFSAMKPMADYDRPCDCPSCGSSSGRVLLSVPQLAMMDASSRHTHSTNEKSAHAPALSTKDSRSHSHGSGCSCCSGSKKKSSAVYGADGSKTFPSKRPWMISH